MGNEPEFLLIVDYISVIIYKLLFLISLKLKKSAFLLLLLSF